MLTPSYDVMNASVSYFAPSDVWSVSLGARNLTDEEYYTRSVFGPNSGAYGGVPGRPRYAYVGFRYEFK